MKIIELINLSKRYKKIVLDNINFSFLEGRTYLIVGENGSGKSTLIKLILGIINPSTGYIKNKIKEISYVPDNLSFPDFLSIDKFLYNLGLLYKLKKNNLSFIIEDLLKSWDIRGTNKLNELSKGMKQKVLIIQALMKDAPIYIFDEPLNGLDKEMQEKFYNQIIKLKSENKTIIIISHQIKEFNDVYDYKLEIYEGKIHERFN